MREFLETYPLGSQRLAAAPPFPDYVQDVVLGTDVLQRVPIPAGALFALFSFDGDVRVKPGTATTALVLPAATSSNGSGSELNPAARRLPPMLGDGVTVPTEAVSKP